MPLLEDCLAGRKRTWIAVEPELAENTLFPKRISGISADFALRHAGAASVTDKALLRLSSLCGDGDHVLAERAWTHIRHPSLILGH